MRETTHIHEMNLICPRLVGSSEISNRISIIATAIFNNLFTLSSNSVVKYLPSVEDILEHILARRFEFGVWWEDSENTLKDISLVIDNGLLQRAGVIIDNRQIRKVLTFPGNKVFYEFTVMALSLRDCLEEGERRRSALLSPTSLYV